MATPSAAQMAQQQATAEQQLAAAGVGSAGAYTPATGTTASNQTAALQWLPNVTSPMPAINDGLDDATLAAHSWNTGTVQVGGSPAGYGKGERFPALSRIADLITIAHRATYGQGFDGVNPNALNDVFQQAGGETGTDYTAGTTVESSQDLKKVAVHALQDVYKQLQALHFNLTPSQERILGKVNNPTQVEGALNTLVNVALPGKLSHQLGQDGLQNTQTLHGVLGNRDLLATGAPGNPLPIAGRTEQGVDTGGGAYTDFVKEFNSGPQGQNALMQQLASAGYLTPHADGTAPTSQDVQKALVQLIQDSATSGQTPDKELQAKATIDPLNQTAAQSFVENVAAHTGVNLTGPQLKQIVSGYVDANNTGQDGADYVYNNITGLLKNPQSGSDPFLRSATEAGGYNGLSQTVAQAMTTTFAKYGLLPPTGQQMDAAIASVLSQSSLGSIYQVNDSAVNYAAEQAKAQAEVKYASLAPQIRASDPTQGITGIMAGYQSQAADLLGVQTGDIDMTNPKWMAWTQGQAGAPMSQQEWQAKVTTDPQYNWQGSSGAKNAMAGAAEGLMNLFGTQAVSPGAFSGISGVTSRPAGG